ncbi:MAG: type II toxin-antitoxin system Phd/YefM family antitoxin [Anaerolineae bacterium]
MKVYTYSEARQNFAEVLEEARRHGAAQIRRRDGTTFLITVEQAGGSPLDVEGVDTGITADEILAFIRDGRRQG